MSEDQTALAEFGGVARLFPLPSLVFFPHTVQPLHVFEPRYRDLAADALSGDRLVAPVLLRPGWEDNYDDRPAIHRIACLGRIVADQHLPDGRYNLVLRGLARVRIREELDTDRPFRLARMDLLQDVSSGDIEELMSLRSAVADLMLPRITDGPIREQLHELFKGELPLGPLCDVLAFALPLPPEIKQELLGILDVTARARRLMEAFRGISEGSSPMAGDSARRFPPDFSVN